MLRDEHLRSAKQFSTLLSNIKLIRTNNFRRDILEAVKVLSKRLPSAWVVTQVDASPAKAYPWGASSPTSPLLALPNDPALPTLNWVVNIAYDAQFDRLGEYHLRLKIDEDWHDIRNH
jgi:2-polyprenyl-6-methoxyphenol hydroxylase-like FAD-dependent oxidoreductase